MALLEFQNIHKSFHHVEVLRGVSFALGEAQVLGLVGENGSGKSTSMNILGGVHRPTRGQMLLGGRPYAPSSPREASRAGVAFIHQELNLFGNLSIEENIFIGGFPKLSRFLPLIHRPQMRRRTRGLLALVDLAESPAAKVSSLSQGERQLVEIAKALSGDAKLIIFDEPTTSLTHRECERLFDIIRRLRAAGIAVIFISHVLQDVLRLTDQIVVLRDGAVAGGGPTARMTSDELVKLMVGRPISQLFPNREKPLTGEPLLEVEHLTQPHFVHDISFQVRAGEILGLSGLMGSGRTELARMLFGLDPFQTGEIRIAGNALKRPSPRRCMEAGMAFVTEDRRQEGLLPSLPIRPNIALASLRDYASPGLKMLDRRTLAADADRSGLRVGLPENALLGKLARNLSGGNQQKVVLAKWLMREPKILILDEPTRGIDIGAKQAIYAIIHELAAAGVAVLMISSELDELIGACDRIAVMNRGEIAAEFLRPDFDQQQIMRAAVWTRKEPSA